MTNETTNNTTGKAGPKKRAVEVKNLTVQFGDFKAVNNVTFAVDEGEIFGFLGANGAGKTTTIRVLCGLLIPNSGEVEVAGVDGRKNSEAIKSHVGYMSQKFTLYDDLTVGENLDFTASLRKLEKSVYLKRREDLLNFISFEKPLKTFVKDLPGGMKQQVSLAASLLHDPEIVFLDEPTAGVSSAARALFWSLIKQLSSRGKTIFVTSHYMDEVEQCGRIALMRSGEIIALDSPSQLKAQTFPKALFELSPLRPFPLDEVYKLRTHPAFEMVEAYGLRYHAVVADESAWKRFMEENKENFEVKTISPTLEDVFIRLVEGKNR